MTAPHSCKILLYYEKCTALPDVFRFVLTLLNHGKWLPEGKILGDLRGGRSGSAQLLRWLFLFLFSLMDLGPAITIAELKGCLLTRHGLLCSASCGLVFFFFALLFSFWPRLLRAPRSQQLDSCVQSETTYNSRRFKRETSA